MAIRGDGPLKIQQRAGHRTFEMTQKYIRTAEAVGEVIGTVFPPLPESLAAGRYRREYRPSGAQLTETIVEAPGIENERGRAAGTISRRGSTIRHEGAPGSVSSRPFKGSDAAQPGTESSQPSRDEYELRDVVEPALARALVLAAEARRWEVVAQIVTELGVRRRTREGTAPWRLRCVR